jgi:hypothetical protein
MVAGAFFFSFWGRNAPSLGQHDAGLALGLSFAVPLTLYTSLCIAAFALLATIAAARRRRRMGRWLAALLISALPLAFLVLVDLL